MKPFSLESISRPSVPVELFIVANASAIDRLLQAPSASTFADASLVRLSAEEMLPQDVVSRARAIVLEVDPGIPASLGRMAAVRDARPDLPIIAALREANISAVRMLLQKGVTDVATLPFEPEELAPQILEALAKYGEHLPKPQPAPMLTMVRSTGGCGSTSILTHLAAEIAEKQDREGRVCLIDLDLQSGDVALFLGEHPKVSVMSLLEAGERLDNDLLNSVLAPTRYGFSIISSPDEITSLDTVNVDQLLKLLTLVRSRFDYVLLDLPADWTNWALSVAFASDTVLLTTDLSIASLRQAKRRLELLSSVGIDADKVKIVVNRVEKKLFKMIGIDEVAETLGHQVIGSIALEGSLLRSAQDEGVLITDLVKKCRFANDVKTLANQLTSASKE